MTQVTVNINTTSKKWHAVFPRMQAKIREAIYTSMLMSKRPAALKDRHIEVDILLTTDARIRTLNRDWRGQDKPTNVLAFPQFDVPSLKKKDIKIYPDPLALGDVVLAIETLKRECRTQNKTLKNHCIHLAVHGTLHLLGYDHIEEKDAKAMEKKECDILAFLGYPDPYIVSE